MNNAQSPNIPLTVLATNGNGKRPHMAIGLYDQPDYNLIDFPGTGNEYWMVILDRSNLKVVENFSFIDGSTIPPKMNSYLDNSEYLYVLTTANQLSASVPTGSFYKWLISEGAGLGLRRVERAISALNCSGYLFFSYTLIGIFGSGDSGSLEYANLVDPTLFSPVELMPTTIDGKTIYSPVVLK